MPHPDQSRRPPTDSLREPESGPFYPWAWWTIYVAFATVGTRSSAAALEVIRDLGDTFVHELWLDHDLGGDDTIRPVSHLEEIAYFGKPMHVGVIYVHSANAGAAEAVLKGLIRYGYNASRTGTDQLISTSVTD